MLANIIAAIQGLFSKKTQAPVPVRKRKSPTKQSTVPAAISGNKKPATRQTKKV